MPPMDFLCKAKVLWVGEDDVTRGKDAAASRQTFSDGCQSRPASIGVGASAQPFWGGLRLPLHGEIKMLMLDRECALSFRPDTSRLDPNSFTSSGISLGLSDMAREEMFKAFKVLAWYTCTHARTDTPLYL